MTTRTGMNGRDQRDGAQRRGSGACGRARRRGRGRVRLRRLGDRLPAGRGRSVGLLLERGHAYPPDSFPRTPARDGRALLGPGRRTVRDVRRLALQRLRLRRLQRAGRRLAHLRERAAPQGRALVRPGRPAAAGRVRVLAGHPGRSRPALRRGRADARRHALPAGGRAVRRRHARRRRCRTPPRNSACPGSCRRSRSASRRRPASAPGPGLPIADPSTATCTGASAPTCRLCGECDIGCNVGAKNSLDYNYLSAARHHGADLRTRHEVRASAPGRAAATRSTTSGTPRRRRADHRRGPPGTITCDRLVLAAGTYGTSFLLLRNRASFPGLSTALGTRFSGNGDLLTFLLHARDRSRTRPLDAEPRAGHHQRHPAERPAG